MRVVLNVLWLVLAGLWLAIGYVIAGLLLCVTMAGAALVPFGKEIVSLNDVSRLPGGAVSVPQGKTLD